MAALRRRHSQGRRRSPRRQRNTALHLAGTAAASASFAAVDPAALVETLECAVDEPRVGTVDLLLTLHDGLRGVRGVVASFTVTRFAQRATLPAASVAVNVTIVSPTGKIAGASLVSVGAGSTESVTVTLARNACTAALLAGTPFGPSLPIVTLPDTPAPAASGPGTSLRASHGT